MHCAIANIVAVACASAAGLIVGLTSGPPTRVEHWIIIVLTFCAAISSAAGLIRAMVPLGPDAEAESRTMPAGSRPIDPAGKDHNSIPVPVEALPPPVTETPLEETRCTTSQSADWFSLVEECVELVKKLDSQQKDLDTARQEMVEYFVSQLQESLQRSGVQVISDEPIYDSVRHQAVPAPLNVPAGARVTETLSPGFAVGERILRRARVRLE